MIIELFPENCWIESKQFGRIVDWTQYRLTLRKPAFEQTDGGFCKGRVSGGNPIRVNAPLAKLSEDGKRVILHNGLDYDPETVLLMARAGRMGMRVVEQEDGR